MSSPITFSHFTVHVFINHDPFIASVFLPDLFSHFPDLAWRLPQEYATPSRPEIPNVQVPGGIPGGMPGSIPHNTLKQLLIDPRKGLGRHIFHQPFPNSITLRDLSESLEGEFGLDRKLIAMFTIFPQHHLEDGTYPEWHDKPLPWNMTLGEVAILDHDAVTTGQYAGVAEQYTPVLHMVVETKAATLKRGLGGILGKHFLVQVLGEPYPYQGDMWHRLEAFINCYGDNYSVPESVLMLWQWRSSFYSLQYLKNERDKLSVADPVNEDALESLKIKIEEFWGKKAEAKQSISLLASQWESWVLKQNYSTDDGGGNGELGDNEVEDKVRAVLGQRRVVEQWGKCKEKESLRGMLRKAWSHKRSSTMQEQQQVNARQPESSNANTDKSEEPRQTTSRNQVSEQASHQAPPGNGAVQAIPFRSANGTLSPELAKFAVKSGILSWGQILPIYYSLTQDKLTNNAGGVLNLLPGGTIKQHVYTYKSAARVGDWKVRQYYSNWGATDPWDPDGEKHPAGWVVCHDGIDPLEVLKKVRAINPGGRAISNGNSHTDKNVLYIGRYDWSHHWHNPQDQDFKVKFHDWAEKALKPDDDQTRTAPEIAEMQTHKQLVRENERIIINLRDKLQQSLFNNEHPPKEEDIPAIDEYINQLEELPHLDPLTLHRTKIYKTLFRIDHVQSIPGEDKFNIKNRVKALVDKFLETLGADLAPEESLAGVKNGGYFIAMDSENFDLDFVKTYKRDCEGESKKVHEVIFRRDGNKFGAYVSFAYTEYEFGWLVFSGRKHADYDADELIAIVYDGAYEVLAGLYHEVETDPLVG